jgi:hypothetical protein
MAEQFKENPILKVRSRYENQILYFFGAYHTNNIDDPQFRELKNIWDEFMSVSRGERMVVVEGVVREISENYEEMIKRNGESGAVTWLAKQENIPTIRVEPSDIEQRKILCSLFESQVVAYALIVQNLAAWFRNYRDSSFSEAIERSVNKESEFASVYGFMPNTSWFHDKHRELFGQQELEDKVFLELISDPRRNVTIVNDVVSNRTQVRNSYIMSAITEAWKCQKSIFIVYGKGHFYALEKSLQNLNDSLI